MFKSFEGSGSDEVWLNMVEGLRCDPDVIDQPSRNGPTKELLHATITLDNPRDRWVVSRTPALNPAYAFAELIWTLQGRNDSPFLTFFNSQLPKYAGEGPTFHGAYGQRLRKHISIDQFTRAYEVLKHNPDSRQVVLQIWDGAIDLPTETGEAVASDIPCSIVALLKARRGRLEWMQIMRSNDIFLGVPYDFVQFTCMQEIFAGWLGLEIGSYCHVSDSLHAYERDLDQVFNSTQVPRAVDSSDLRISLEESKIVLGELERNVERIIEKKSTAADLMAGLTQSKLPQSYRDMLSVLTAEGLRKRKEKGACQKAISTCTNPLYHQLWTRWAVERTTKKLDPSSR